MRCNALFTAWGNGEIKETVTTPGTMDAGVEVKMEADDEVEPYV